MIILIECGRESKCKKCSSLKQCRRIMFVAENTRASYCFVSTRKKKYLKEVILNDGNLGYSLFDLYTFYF